MDDTIDFSVIGLIQINTNTITSVGHWIEFELEKVLVSNN